MKSSELKRVRIQFRQYMVDANFPIFAFTEGNWPLDRIVNANDDGPIRYMHFHNCIEFGYCLCGSGQLFVEDRCIEYSGGDLMVVLPYTAHITRPLSHCGQEEKNYCEFLYIDPAALIKQFYPDGMPILSLLEGSASDASCVLRGDKYPELSRLIADILAELRDKPADYRDCVKGLSLAVLVQLTRIVSGKSMHGLRGARSILAIFPAIRHINDAYAERITTKQLSERCFLSETHFRRIFKTIMGCSPLEYIHQMRVHRACERLYSSNDSILSTSLAVGFDSVSSFNRQFAQIMGVAPSVWRRKKRGDKETSVNISSYDATRDG